MLGLVSVDLAEGSSRCRHVGQGVLELALLLFQQVGDLEGRLGGGEGGRTEVGVVDQISFFEVLEGFVFVLHTKIESPEVVVDLCGLDVVGTENSQTANQ
jgi:hypothetical protein